MSEMGAFVTSYYADALRRAGLVDMGDLQCLALELLGQSAVLRSLRERHAPRHLRPSRPDPTT